MINLIGISGRAGSGKDLIASIIQYLIWKNKVEKGEYTNLHYNFEDFTNSRFGGNTLSNWEIKKFADKLKDIVCLLTGCTRTDLEDREFKNNHKFRFENKWYGSVREFLQYFGTDLIRKNLGDDIWINATFSDYKPPKLSEYNPSQWLISDVRFPNELKAIKDRGGICIRVERHNHPNDTNPNTEHESESALDNSDDFDYIVINDGTIDELIEKVKEILIKEKII